MGRQGVCPRVKGAWSLVAGKGKSFKPMGNKKSGKSNFEKAIDDLLKPKKAKGQDSRKVHDTKGKNNHGRRY